MTRCLLMVLALLVGGVAVAQSEAPPADASPVEAAPDAEAASAPALGRPAPVEPAPGPLEVEVPLEPGAAADAAAIGSTPQQVETRDPTVVATPTLLPEPGAVPVETGDAGTRSDLLGDFIDGVVDAQRREFAMPALGLAVVRADAPELLRGYGKADYAEDRAVDPQRSLFRIGSVSKTFIWTAVLILVERGQLDLDADVNTYLESVRIEEGFGAPVTLRHLMAHRAGFEDSLRLFSVLDDDPRSLAQLLAAHQPKRVYAPGARTSYSNWGSALAAQVVEDVSGIAYGDFLRREILDPLGMTLTTWQVPEKLSPEQTGDAVQGYTAQGRSLQARSRLQLGAYWPAGGIASTPAEMARWMRFHLGGGELEGVRLLRPETHALLLSRPFDDRPGSADTGHGLISQPYRGSVLWGHGGATASFFSNLVLVPERGLGVFISHSGTDSRGLVRRLPEQILDRLRGESSQLALAAEPGDAGALAAANGEFLPNRRVFTSFAAVFSSLDVASLEAINADTLRLVAGSRSGEYSRIGEDLFESIDGQRLALLRGARGDVAGFADGSGVHSFERVDPLARPIYLHGSFGLALLLALSSLLGIAWRFGRRRERGASDTAARSFAGLSALVMLGTAVCIVLLAMRLGNVDAATFAGTYPPPEMLWVHWAGWAIAGTAGLMLLGLPAAWTSPRMGFFARLHYTLFALTLAVLAAQLYLWKVIGAGVY
jgi:CubicO group peptidase (beta-lactamase class C family)